MDPEEWERQADSNAAALTTELDRLQADFWPESPVATFAPFWPRMKNTSERIRTAPAIRLEDKLALQARLAEMVKRARVDQTRLREEQQRSRQALADALELAHESLQEAATVTEISEVRADLMLLRERITGSERPADRETQSRLWARWQELNTGAWEKLNEHWRENESALSALLDRAQALLDAQDQRGAREQVQAFHTAAGVTQCSHAALRSLRERARSIWTAADALAKEKRASYLATASRRVGQWRVQRERNCREREGVQREIEALQSQELTAATPLAGALIRAQVTERVRRVTELERENKRLEEQIEAADRALAGR